MRILLCLFFLSLFGGCTWWQMASTFVDIAEEYPSDNPLESLCEDVLESQTGIDIDISFWDDDEDKGWGQDSQPED